ncbi:MAG TPA: glycosyltransferase, partial [Bacteroidales bacterium]|nr:glycosyltransferase [Bacteroidales bacterium]
DQIPFKLIELEINHGKSYAMVEGVKNSAHEIILFWDADITGIQKEHFTQLIDPIISEEADMVLGVPKETLINYRVNPFKSLTGERALIKKDIEPILDNIREINFGVETYINLYLQAHGKKIKYSLLDGLVHPTKYKKTTSLKATKEFISEGKEIATTLLKNYDLITKRISNSFEDTGKQFKSSLEQVQKEMNEKIQALLKNNG